MDDGRRMRKQSILVGLAIALGLLPSAAADREITVSAAASLQSAFVDIGKQFEAAQPGIKVVFNFGSSGQLVQQISKGAPADVLATADLDTMDRADQKNLIVRGTRANFASNTLVLVAPVEGSSAVSSIQDLRGDSVRRIALGKPESVPAGQYAKEGLELEGLWGPLQSRIVFGQNVRQVLDYVARGEVDAGFVYATDARLMKARVKEVAPIRVQRPILYPIAAVKGSGKETAARRFIEMVTSESGQRILAQYGFTAP